jgi:hypothetical protein
MISFSVLPSSIYTSESDLNATLLNSIMNAPLEMPDVPKPWKFYKL